MLSNCCWPCRLVEPVWKTIWQVFIKLKISLPYNLAIPLVGIYPMEVKTVHTEMCTLGHSIMFIAPLFVITPNCKQARCLSTGKIQYFHTMENYSSVKRNSTDTCNIMDKPQKYVQEVSHKDDMLL